MSYKSLESEEIIKKQKITARLVLAVIGITAGSFTFGYNIGVVNAPEELIKDFLNSTQYDRDNSYMPESVLTNLWAFTVAIFSLGGCIGGFFAGWWATKIGRKRGCLANTLVGVMGAALMYFSKTAKSYEMIIVGRLVIGVCAGLYTGLCPMYLSEISTPDIRGALGVIHNLAAVTGILAAQILGFPEVLGTADQWEILLGITVVPLLIQMLILPMCEDSPRYLFINKGDVPGTQKALTVLRGKEDNDDEISEIIEEMNSNIEKVSIVQLFITPYLRRPLIICIVMQLSQQLSGVNAVLFYSTGIFKDAAKLSTNDATHVTSVIGAVFVVMTIVSVPLMDRAGRRTMQLVGLAGCTFWSAMMTVFLVLKTEVSWFNIASIPAVLLFIVFFSLGPASLPWLIGSELFAHAARPAAVSVSVVVNWLASFTVGYVFPEMKAGLGDFCFLPFIIISILTFIYLFMKLPETKGRTFQEISRIYQSEEISSDRKTKGRGNDVMPWSSYTNMASKAVVGKANLTFESEPNLYSKH